MSSFEYYYKNFIGFENNVHTSNHLVIESEYRDMPLNQQYYYPIIFSEYGEHIYCSSSYQFYNICKTHFNATILSINQILTEMNKSRNYRLRKMSRYTTDDDFSTEAITLTEKIIRELDFRFNNDKEEYISRKKSILEEKRQFAIIENNQIASTAFISDIYCKGGNIVVYTDPEYRHHGYGKEVVKACINWCHEHNLLPIYLVEEDNVPSIKLAKSLKLSLKSSEWIISE